MGKKKQETYYSQLFGLPILIDYIEPSKYNKKYITNIINKNYTIQKTRQNWLKDDFFKTDIHHSNGDEDNDKFLKIDYSSLKNSYDKIILKYIKNIYPTKEVGLSYKIVNYTASKEKTFMAPHNHIDCDFAMVHYIQFDKEHSQTTFQSPYIHTDMWERGKNIKKYTDSSRIENTWLYPEWQYKMVENQIIVFPSILKHYVRNVASKNLRMTIATNIYLNKA